MHLRLITVLELMREIKYYLNMEIFKKVDNIFRRSRKIRQKNKMIKNLINNSFIFRGYHKQARKMVRNGCCLSVVLQRKIKANYPPVNQRILINTYDKLIEPHSKVDSKNNKEIDQEPLNIFWTN